MREYFVISREWQGAASVARQTVKFATVYVLLFIYWDDNDDRYDGDPYPSVKHCSIVVFYVETHQRIEACRWCSWQVMFVHNVTGCRKMKVTPS